MTLLSLIGHQAKVTNCIRSRFCKYKPGCGVSHNSNHRVGVWGNTDKGLGVIGTANFGAGAPTEKITDQGIGVIGLANSGVGVAGERNWCYGIMQ